MRRLTVCLLAAAAAQTAPGQVEKAPPIIPIATPGIVAPRQLKAVEPEYSEVGRQEGVSGRVVLQIVIDKAGLPTNISVISPLGFDLDEKAVEAVQKWTFVPATKDGIPVAVFASIEVNFKMLPGRGDEKRKEQESALREASENLTNSAPGTPAAKRAVKSMQALAKQGYRPAVFALGMLEVEGKHVPKDVPRGLDLVEKAAERHYAPALYEIGLRRIEGRDVPEDAGRGSEEVHEAARRGSVEAQFYLGDRYERGNGLPRDIDSARLYLGPCAARGVARCQYRYGLTLIDAPRLLGAEELAVAWIQLAAEQGLPEAKETAAIETAKLAPQQLESVKSFKALITSAK
jgi:TonB family protein